MKRLAFIVAGASLAGVLGYFALSVLATWLAPRWVRSDDDIGAMYVIWLVVQLLAVVAGGVVGNALYRRGAA